MSNISIDTEKTKYLSSMIYQNVEDFEASILSLKSMVENADWQAPARDEFIGKFDNLVSQNNHSLRALEIMGKALDEKTSQWEIIAQKFNGAYQQLSGVWDSVFGFLSKSWNSILGGFSNINFPSMPSLTLPTLSAASILAGIKGSMPEWDFKKPDWWPFDNEGDVVEAPKYGPEPVAENQENLIQKEGLLNDLRQKDVIESKSEANITLNDVYPENYNSCAVYAQNRRKELGRAVDSPKIFPGAEKDSAINYIYKFPDASFQINGTEGNLEANNVIQKGFAMVWEPNAGGAHDTHGHIAIVEKVEGNVVTVSQSGWSEKNANNDKVPKYTKEFSIDYLIENNIWFIGEI